MSGGYIDPSHPLVRKLMRNKNKWEDSRKTALSALPTPSRAVSERVCNQVTFTTNQEQVDLNPRSQTPTLLVFDDEHSSTQVPFFLLRSSYSVSP